MGARGRAISRIMVRPNNTSGFTLLEVLAVLAITALVLAIALPRIGMNASPAATEATAMRMIGQFEYVRYAARRRGVTLTVELDIPHNQIRLPTHQTPITLPPTMTLNVRSASPCDPTGRHIIFYADGTACAPAFALISATTSRMIVINSLTGAISLAP
jgi:general secretion pathway protein H